MRVEGWGNGYGEDFIVERFYSFVGDIFCW